MWSSLHSLNVLRHDMFPCIHVEEDHVQQNSFSVVLVALTAVHSGEIFLMMWIAESKASDLPNQNNFYQIDSRFDCVSIKTFGTTLDSKEISGSVQTSNRLQQCNHNQKRLIVNFNHLQIPRRPQSSNSIHIKKIVGSQQRHVKTVYRLHYREALQLEESDVRQDHPVSLSSVRSHQRHAPRP